MASTNSFTSSPSSVLTTPFPDDVPTAPLVTISLSKLIAPDDAEHARLLSAAKSLGFFYLDMRGSPEGERLLREADSMFTLMKQFFALPEEEKMQYDFASQQSYFGYKGIGKEVVDGKGTKDRNEIYNVCVSTSTPTHRVRTDQDHALHRYPKTTSSLFPRQFPLQLSLMIAAKTSPHIYM